MIKVGITLEGSVKEMASILQYISSQQKEEGTLHEAEYAEVTKVEEERPVWTEGKVRSIYRGVSYECRRLLREVAKHEDGISTSALAAKLGTDEHGVGGTLSSLGRQLNNPEVKGLQYPLDWTKYGAYKMLPIWRNTIAKISKE